MRGIQSSDEHWQMTPPLHYFEQPQEQQYAGHRLLGNEVYLYIIWFAVCRSCRDGQTCVQA